MCGISGIVDRPATGHLEAVIRRINSCMSHRGPDAEGFFVEDEVALGHRRLSIIDLSTAANQPFEDASGRYMMVFNGEIYNFMDIKAKLPDYPFRTHSDTEVAIAAYGKWGPAALEEFRGMFAIAIWDRRERSLFIARDRFGVKPLYYTLTPRGLIFASEIRAILASDRVPKKVNKKALDDYLKYQSFTAPYTLVENILQVPAGAYMIYKDGRCETKVYWDVTEKRAEIADQDPAGIRKRIEELLYRSVERRLVSDVPLGAFLSGGIDSSAVVAIMSRVSRSRTKAFTLAFEEKEFNELPYAEMLAKKYQVDHSVVMVRPQDFLDKLPTTLDAMDSPSGDGPNTYVVSEAIRKSGITVALSGIGGDELFAGYPMFRQFHRLKQLAPVFDHIGTLRKLAAAFIPSGDRKLNTVKSLLSSPDSDITNIYPNFRQIHNTDKIRCLRAATGRPATAAFTLEEELKAKRAAIDRFEPLAQVSIADYLGYTQNVLLKDADQMSMAVSLELREPFFDHDLVEYVLNIPDNIKFPAYPKKLLVESLGDLLPQEIVFRKKQGFVLPYDLWMRGDLRRFCDEKIRGLAARGIFEEEKMVAYWNRFLERRSNIRWSDIWIFVVLEHWLEKNQVS